MERKFISDYGTLEPYGYNIREGGGRSERVSDVSRNIMIEKQREISKRRNGLLGRIVGNRKSSNCYYDHHRKKWLVSFYVKNKNVYLGRYDTEREALNVADEFRKLHFTPETYI